MITNIILHFLKEKDRELQLIIIQGGESFVIISQDSFGLLSIEVQSRAKPGDNDDKYYSSFPQNKDRELKLIIIQGVIDEIGPDPEWLCEESQAGNRLATDHLPRRVRVITITGTRLSLLKHLCLTWK